MAHGVSQSKNSSEYTSKKCSESSSTTSLASSGILQPAGSKHQLIRWVLPPALGAFNQK